MALASTTEITADSLTMRLDGTIESDVLRGHNVAEIINGDDGDDKLFGRGGDDTISGDDGDDALVGGLGADTLDGGDGFDRAIYRRSTEAVTVDLAAGTGAGGDAEGDILIAIEQVVGSAFADHLVGSAVDNRLTGNAGNDVLAGGAGNDTLEGGAGADTLDGGDGIDRATYANSAAGVTVNLALSTAAGGDAQGDTLTGIEQLIGSAHADQLSGDAAANRLTGDDGDDTLSGGGGNDVLVGGNDSDTMTGGAGVDTFLFGAGSGQDIITDFWAGTGRTDRIRFIDNQFTDFTGVLANVTDGAHGVTIALGGGNTFKLLGVHLGGLAADDFLLV